MSYLGLEAFNQDWSMVDICFYLKKSYVPITHCTELNEQVLCILKILLYNIVLSLKLFHIFKGKDVCRENFLYGMRRLNKNKVFESSN